MTVIRANQALHGYRDGHRLLQSSIKLSPESHSILLANSDATGPAVQQGFDTYLSGFGLPAERMFVFARTWFALEMERPGCVWTHSLLLDWHMLRHLTDYSAILSVFRRPIQSPTSNFDEFGRTIEIPNRQHVGQAAAWPSQITAALAALYADDRRPVVLSTDRSDRWDEAMVSIWACQWWTLRRSLAFCTGQLSERQTTRRIDIQVVPQERNFRWRHSDAILISDEEPHLKMRAWIRQMERAWRAGTPIDATLSLQLSASLPADRTAGPLVTEIANFFATSTAADSVHLLERIASQYSQPTAAAELKYQLLGDQGLLWGRAEEVDGSGSDIARYILLSERGAAFDRNRLGIQRRLESIWRTSRADATALLLDALRADATDAINELVRAACASLTEQDLIHLAQSEPGTIHALVHSQPALLLRRELWESSPQVRRELAAALVRAGAGQPMLASGAIVAAIQAGAIDALADLLRRVEVPVFAEIATTVVDSLPSIPGWQAQAIVAALRHRATDLIHLWKTGVLSPRTGKICLMTVCEPTIYYGRLLGHDIMMRIAKQDDDCGQARVGCVGPTFALVVALDEGGEVLLEAGTAAFATVHAAAANSGLDQWSLDSLDRVLPRLGWRRDWDICERLRLAVAERLIEERWPLASLFRVLPEGREFEWLVHTIHGQRHGRQLLKDASKRGASIGATEVQMAIVRACL